MPRARWILQLALFSVALPFEVAAVPPHIGKPRPVPANIPPNMPALPPAVFDKTLTIGGNNVKAREVDTRLTVAVEVNGRGPYNFIVDSGADTSAVGVRVAHDLQLPLGTPTILDGTTERSVVDRVKVLELGLGESTIRDLELPALREVDMGGTGIVGIDVLVRQRLMMDFEKNEIKVEDSSKPVVGSPGDIVIIARRQRGQLILTEVAAAGLQLDAIIDTGSEITIGNLALRDRLLRGNYDKFRTVPAIGVTGATVNLQVAKIGELQLGPVVLYDVPMAFADVPPFAVFGLSHEPALLLGTDVLKNFRRVSLDFRARKVRFQLRSCKTEGIVVNTTSEDTFTRIRPVHAESDLCGRF